MPPIASAGKNLTPSAPRADGRVDLGRRARAREYRHIRRPAEADQLGIRRRRDDELGAGVDDRAGVFERSDRAGADQRLWIGAAQHANRLEPGFGAKRDLGDSASARQQRFEQRDSLVDAPELDDRDDAYLGHAPGHAHATRHRLNVDG